MQKFSFCFIYVGSRNNRSPSERARYDPSEDLS